MNVRSQSFYMENGNLGWPVPSLKQLFSSAVTYKKKFQKGIISSWEGYNNNHVNITIYVQSICMYEILRVIGIHMPYIGLFVDSSLGDASMFSSKFDSCLNPWLGRHSSWWKSCFSIQAWKLGRIHVSHGWGVATQLLQASWRISEVWIGLVG